MRKREARQIYLQSLREEEYKLYLAIYEIEQMSDKEFIDLEISENLNRDEYLKKLHKEYDALVSEIEKEEEGLNENKRLNEAEETGFTIEYPNGDFYIGKPMDLYVLMTDFLINWDEDKTTMTEYEAENVASIRENYKEVFYAALEGGNYWKGQEFEEAFGRFSDYEIANALSINESKTLNEGTINFTYSNYDLPTYVLDLDEYLDEYYDEADKYFFEEETMRELVKMVKLANQELKEQQSRLVSELNNKEVAQVLEELGHGLYDDDDYNRDALEYEELLELAVWPGYYQGVSIGFNNVDPDLIRMRTEGTPTVKNFANSLIGAAEDLLAKIADETNMRKARSGGWAGPVYLDEAKSKLNKNKRKKLNKNKTLTEALDYNEEFDEVIFELYYERIEDGTDIKELEDARKLLKTYNLNFKEEVKRGWPVFVIQDNLDKVVDFIADYMGYYGEELIEMLQDSVEPVGGGEIPEEELFILATIKGLL